MALVNCPECSQEMSSEALFCPHCGFPYQNHLRKQNAILKGLLSKARKENKINKKLTNEYRIELNKKEEIIKQNNLLKEKENKLLSEKIKLETEEKLLKEKLIKETEEKLEKEKQVKELDCKLIREKMKHLEETNKLNEQLNKLEKKVPVNSDDIKDDNNKFEYVLDYVNENKFRKLERSLKKYNRVAYEKLNFEYYPVMRKGDFPGNLLSVDKKNYTQKYELRLPSDKRFAQIHGDFKLIYIVYKKEKLVKLETITPEDILIDGDKGELTTYKGVMISKENASKDMFKIDLLDMLQNK